MVGEFTMFIAQDVNCSNWVEIAKIVGAGIAFLIGVSQYSKAQVWKRVEFVASEMKTFFDDEAAKAAMTMLDWRRKEMTLYKFRNENDFERVQVSYSIVAISLGTDPEFRYDKVPVGYTRDI